MGWFGVLPLWAASSTEYPIAINTRIVLDESMSCKDLQLAQPAQLQL
jgi:hypothetical protein